MYTNGYWLCLILSAAIATSELEGAGCYQPKCHFGLGGASPQWWIRNYW